MPAEDSKPPKTLLPLAVRVYPEPKNENQHDRPLRHWQCPDAMLVFDTETRTDATQRLTFGSYRFLVAGQCHEEGLFYADDLPDTDLAILKRYVATHRADVVEGNEGLRLLSLAEFLDRFYRAVYKSRCLLVGFNLPFDFSRIAGDVAPARGRFAGGFSLGLWFYIDEFGQKQRHPHRPRIGIKQMDSKRALKGFTGQNSPDKSDLIPEGSETGKPEKGYKFRGHFLDLRTLAFALTDQSYSLESACEAFGVEHGKQQAARHGEVTEEYIDYNRRDVLATSELAAKLIEEYNKHGLSLQVTKAYSPASIGKAYLREMGIEPILKRQPDFPKQYLGYAQSAFFGGRTSAHIRKIAVPVVYTDFLSMYPTVNSLMKLWQFVIARQIKVIEHCQDDILHFLSKLKENSGHLFNPSTWQQLTAFVKLIPDGDILPNRSKYNAASNDWQVAVNYLYAGDHEKNQALWFSLPDVIASVLLTGKTPQIIDAFRLEAHGVQDGLKPAKLYGAIEIDPRQQDFFRRVIEERKRLSSQTKIPQSEKKKLDKALKVLANATSYGIYAEMNRQESDRAVKVQCCGIDAEGFTCSIAHPDVPGEYCFPPMASLITGAARLMLALLEHSVSDLGGTYSMEDTDSMAIVATENGGIISCAGGPLRTKNNREAIKALSWADVRQMTKRFASLNPYAHDAVPGSILKIEEDNLDPETHKQRQLYCLAISAKRYALFSNNQKNDSVLLRYSEHGLGHLLNPTKVESEDREWIAQTWRNIIRKADGLSAKHLEFEHIPAVGRISVSSPAVLRPLNNLNAGKGYADQIKPFNFVLSCHVQPLGQPIGCDPEHFHLIAPFESDSRKWANLEWINQYSGKNYRITTIEPHGSRHSARIKTYKDILIEYEFHAEAKNADAKGNPSGKQTLGLVQRRHIQIEQIKYIGKESNSIEDVESGLAHSAVSIYTEYPDPSRDEWETNIRPALKEARLGTLEKETGLSRRTLIYARTGKRKPHRKHRDMIASALRKLNLI